MRAPAAFLDLPDDAAGHVVAGEELGRAARRLVALGIAPAFLLVVGGLRLVQLGNVVEHETAPLAVAEHATFAPHALGHEDAADARRPHHPGGVELHELHVHELGARVVRQGVPVPRVLPAVARDLEGAPDAAGGEDDGARPEHLEAATLALVAEGADDAPAVGQQAGDRALHVDVDPEVDPVILQRANHLETGAVADVREAGIAVSAEVALQDAAVGGAVEHRAPRLELADAIRRLLRVQLRHPPVVHVLAAAHRVGEVHLPVVAVVHVGEGRGNAALGHDGVRLAEERLAHEAHRYAGRRRFDGRAQPRAPGADDDHVVLVRLVVGHQKIRTSDHTPIEHSRTYRSAKPTPNRLAHAHDICLRFRQLTQSYVRSPKGARER